MPVAAKVHEAVAPSGSCGELIKGSEITKAQAIAIRQAGRDIVVCGDDTKAKG